MAWTPRQREILTLLRDQGETFFWDFPWKPDGRLLHSLEVLMDGHGVVARGNTVVTPPRQDLPSTGSFRLSTAGKTAAAQL